MSRMLAVVVAVLFASTLSAEPRVQKNLVYGMYSGLALLMDAHLPDSPNGFGVVLIPGSGFHLAQGYDAVGLKDAGASAAFVYLPRLLRDGFTVFVVNHRAAPRFRYPAPVEDVQRAVRFIRHHAADFNIRGDRLGALGYSSGGYLAAMLGVLEGRGEPSDRDPINRLSARVQAVVANAANADLTFDLQNVNNSATVTSFIGMPLQTAGRVDPVAARLYTEASPVAHVSRTAAPVLLIHGDADETVAFRHSEALVQRANQASATVKLVKVPGGTHRFGVELATHSEWPDVLSEATGWFDRYLKEGAK